MLFALVVIWGVGFPDRPYSIRDIKLAEFIDFLKNNPEYGGCSVMLGVPTHWRASDQDFPIGGQSVRHAFLLWRPDANCCCRALDFGGGF